MCNLKKYLALFVAVVMLLGVVGCNAPSDPVSDTTNPAETPTQGEEPTQAETPTQGEEPTQGNAPVVDANLTVHENTYFTVGYDEADGWTLAEDDFYISETGGNVYLRILDDDGYTGLLLFIEAYEEGASYYREKLYGNGVDLKAYAEGTWPTEEIGGLQMAVVDKGDGERYFYTRNVEAGISYTVNVTDWEHTSVPAVLKNITFTASGTDNIDPPWPWEGVPFAGATASQTVGTHTLTAEFMPMSEPKVTYETFNHDIAVVGDRVYLLSDYALSLYTYDSAALSFVKDIPLEGEYEVLEQGGDGNIIVSSFMEPVIGHDGETAQFSYEGPDKFAVAPDGTWGISWFFSADECQLYSFNDGALTGTPFPFEEVDSISQVNIDDQYILVSGSAKEDGEQYVFVYDYSGELQLKLGGEPDGYGLGSITYATSTPNGFLALDGNMREVVLWTADGTWIGAADDADLFGTSYPWIAAADMADDGSILVVMSETRADESADEVLVFRLSGF